MLWPKDPFGGDRQGKFLMRYLLGLGSKELLNGDQGVIG